MLVRAWTVWRLTLPIFRSVRCRKIFHRLDDRGKSRPRPVALRARTEQGPPIGRARAPGRTGGRSPFHGMALARRLGSRLIALDPQEVAVRLLRLH